MIIPYKRRGRKLAPLVSAAHKAGGYLWNSPNTLLGCVGALGGRGTWQREERICEVCGGWLTALLQCWKLADAITLGDMVLYADESMVPVLRAHEMVHVHQSRRWGPFFLPAYGLESLWQWLRTGEGYRNNRFERAAYDVIPPPYNPE